MARKDLIVVKGEICFSFGKNGSGLSDELLVIGNLVNQLSKDNFIFIEDAFIDACDDVYSLKFHIQPHDENEFYLETEEERAERRKKQEEAIK